MSWWPYGEAAEKLARAVLSGDPGFARRHAEHILEEAERMKRFQKIEKKLCAAVDACQWGEADKLIEQMEQVGIWDTPEIVRYQTIISFERDTTVLDRIVEATSDE